MDMKPYMPLMRDKMMMCGIHTYEQIGKTKPYQLFYSGYGSGIFTVEFFYDTFLLLNFGNSQIAQNTLEIYLSFIEKDGFLPRHVEPLDPSENNPFFMYEQEEHAQPHLFRIALLIARKRGGDLSWLTAENYERLKAYLAHWLKYWVRDESGLCVVNSAPHACADTAFERAGIWRSLYCASVGQNADLYAEMRAASVIAGEMGFAEDMKAYTALAEEHARRIQKYLWNEEDGIFYDYDIRSGQPIRLKHCHCFDVLDTGLATQAQAQTMVRRHICNPEEFWTEYPIPSYALTEEAYTQYHVLPEGEDFVQMLGDGHCNWNGGLWPHSAYRLAHGLALYGYTEQAMHIARKCQELVARNPLLHEWYNPVTGDGCGTTPFYAGIEILLCFLEEELKCGYSPFPVRAVSEPLGNEAVMSALDIDTIPEDL